MGQGDTEERGGEGTSASVFSFVIAGVVMSMWLVAEGIFWTCLRPTLGVPIVALGLMPVAVIALFCCLVCAVRVYVLVCLVCVHCVVCAVCVLSGVWFVCVVSGVCCVYVLSGVCCVCVLLVLSLTVWCTAYVRHVHR